jgi:gas vesicle protein
MGFNPQHLTFRLGLRTTRRTYLEILDHPHSRNSSNQEPAITTMKRVTSVAMALTALFGLAVLGCDKKTSDDLKQKAEETKRTVERKAKEAQKAADKQIEKAKPKLREFGKKAKDATQEAMEKTEEAANSAAQKLKEATNTSPHPASPTPAP